MPKEYRGRTRIVLDILHAIKEDPGLGITRLLYVSNLSHDRLTDYASDLRDRGIVEERENDARKAYHLTEKGERLLAELRKIQTFMSDFGLDM